MRNAEPASRSRVLILVLISIVLMGMSPVLLAFLYSNLGNIYVLRSSLINPDFTHLVLAQGFFDQAERIFSLSRVPYWRGQAYSLAGQRQRALDTWRTFPDADYWFAIRGQTELACGRVETAWSLLETAALLNPVSSTTRYYGGIALTRMERYTEALTWYNQALTSNDFDRRFVLNQNDRSVWWPARPDNLTHNPSRAMTYVQMSAVYYQLQQWELMRDAAQAAVDLDPYQSLGYLQLGTSYFMLGNLYTDRQVEFNKLAAEAYLAVADQMPDYQIGFFLHLARVHWAQGDIPSATAAYDRVARTSRHIANHREVMRFYEDTGQTKMLVSLYDDLIDKTPYKAQFSYRWIAAAEAYFAAGMPIKACALFQTGINICDEAKCDVQDSVLLDVCTGQE
jgi:tetratricopeptide (TPR) repeat protein